MKQNGLFLTNAIAAYLENRCLLKLQKYSGVYGGNGVEWYDIGNFKDYYYYFISYMNVLWEIWHILLGC